MTGIEYMNTICPTTSAGRDSNREMEYKICKICKHNCPEKGCEFSDSTFKKELIRGELVRCSGFVFNVDTETKGENRYQQKQPMPDSTKLIELWHEDKEMLKEKDFRNDQWRLAYNAFLCGFGRGIAVNKQEQPEEECEDLEEAAKKYDEAESWRYEALKYPRREAFEAGAEWQKAKMLKDNPVIMSVEDFQALIDSHAKRVEADYKEKMLKEAEE